MEKLKNLKYYKEIKSLNCDFKDFDECENKEAYRWVFADINNEKNFLPVALREGYTNRNDYKDWALSFFDTQVKAKTKLLKMTKDKKFLFKILGDKIAKGFLNKTDGISNNPGKSGHFDHFEYKDIDLKLKFELVE